MTNPITTHRVTFPSVHANTQPFTAEVQAPSYAHALRDVFEYCAAEGHALEYVRIVGLDDLAGAHLDGLQLLGCRLQQCNLSGVSLRKATITESVFENVFADSTTHLDGSIIEGLRLIGCKLDGMTAKAAQLRAIRFEHTSARGLDVTDSTICGVRVIRSDLAKWRMGMTYASMFENLPGVIDAADMSTNEKAAVRALTLNGGNRKAAQTFLSELEAQATA